MFFTPDSPEGSGGTLPPYSDTVNPKVIAVTTTFLVLAIIIYCLRIWSRLQVYRSIGLDDYAITLGLIMTIVNWAVTIDALVATGGRHFQYIHPSAMLKYAQIAFFSLPIWVWSMTFIKVSVSLLFLRIEQARKWKIGIWTFVGVQLTAAIATTLIQMLQCRPISYNWSLLPGHCWSAQTIRVITYTVAAFYITTDLICAFLPLHFILQLSRPFREKAVLSVLMALGLLASGCGIAKTIVLKKGMDTPDVVFDGSNIIIWSSLEQYIAIIAACVPCLKALLQSAFKALGGQITSLNRGSKRTSASTQHALKSYEGSMEYSTAKWGIRDSSEEVLVTTVTGPNSQTVQLPIMYEEDVESQRIRKEMDISWSENKP